MKNDELLLLRGGYDGNYYWDCYDPMLYCGCISTVTNDQCVASFYCGWFTGCPYAEGPFGSGSGCHLA